MSASTPSVWATRANALTLLRLLAIPPLVAAIHAREPHLAGALFALAVATDLADGWVARRYGEATPVGGLVDHGVDALFVTAGAAAWAWRGELPALLPCAIAIAFAQYVLDSRPGPQLRASWLGRWNGIAYFVAVGIPTVRDALALPWPPAALVRAIGWLLLASTLVSIADRLVSRRASIP